MTDDPHDWLGVELSGGRYRVIAKLGQGGMGAVYRARDANLDCDVVVKVPHPLMLQQREFAQRFAQEIRSLVQLTHPHIVKISDVGQRQGTPFAVMAYLAGGDLDERRPQDGQGKSLPMTAESLTDWLPAVAKALDYIHDEKYVHRDVKPANIIFDKRGNAFLSDFGIVKTFVDSSQAEQSKGLTGTGMVLGTADYMAPEIVLDEDYDGRADQYSLAVTVYELLSGQRPFAATAPAAVLVEKATKNAPALSSIAPHLPKPLCEAVDRALAKDPTQRFASCAVFATAAMCNSPVQTAISHRADSTGSVTQPPVVAEPPIPPSQTLRIACPSCGRKLKAPRSVIGQQLKCPNCSAPLRLYNSGELTLLAEDQTVNRSPHETVASSSPIQTLPASVNLRLISRWPSFNHSRGLLHRIFTGPYNFVNCVAITPDGQTVVCSSTDKRLWGFDMQTGHTLWSFKRHTRFVSCVAITPDGRTALSGSYDKTIKLWDLQTGKEKWTLAGHTSYVFGLAITPDGRTALSGSFDKTLKVWDLQTGREKWILTGHSDGVTCVAISPDGQAAISGSYDKTLKVWDLQTGRENWILTGHTSSVTCVAIAPDGRTVASGERDRTIKVWDLVTGQEKQTLFGHTESITCMVITPDGQNVISGSRDYTLKAWGLETGKQHCSLHVDSAPRACAIAPDGQTLIVGDAAGQLSKFRIQ